MKKKLFWIIAAVLMLLPFAGQAQKYEFKPGSDLSLSIGASPLDATFGEYVHWGDPYYDYAVGPNYDKGMGLRGLYENGDIRRGDGYITGVIMLAYTYKFKKWFELSACLSYSGYYADYYQAFSTERLFTKSTHSIGVMPMARFVYHNRKYLKLYSGIGFGLTLRINKYGSDAEYCIDPAISLNYFGIRIGNKVYGFADFSIGTAGLVSAGIGVQLN